MDSIERINWTVWSGTSGQYQRNMHYDSDNEKSIEITADNNTKMEGAPAISNIKQGNWADINYTVVNGKNVAKSIMVEKDDTATEAPES